MTDIPGPPEQVERLRPEAAEKGSLQKKVADATPPSGKAAPEADSPDHAVKRALQPGGVGEKAELEAKVGQAPEERVGDQSFDSPEQKAKAGKFAKNFGDRPGADHVKEDAIGDNWSKRAGADHHIDTAYELENGGNRIKAFEDPFHPESSSAQNRADIVTEDDYVVECKTAWGDASSPSTIRSAFHQAETRLEPNAEGKAYKGVVVTVPDGKLTGEAADVARRLEAHNPRIRFCAKSQVNQTLADMRARRRQ